MGLPSKHRELILCSEVRSMLYAQIENNFYIHKIPGKLCFHLKQKIMLNFSLSKKIGFIFPKTMWSISKWSVESIKKDFIIYLLLQKLTHIVLHRNSFLQFWLKYQNFLGFKLVIFVCSLCDIGGGMRTLNLPRKSSSTELYSLVPFLLFNRVFKLKIFTQFIFIIVFPAEILPTSLSTQIHVLFLLPNKITHQTIIKQQQIIKTNKQTKAHAWRWSPFLLVKHPQTWGLSSSVVDFPSITLLEKHWFFCFPAGINYKKLLG